MVARALSVGVVLGVASLVAVSAFPLPAAAGFASWPGYPGAAKRPEFRPLQRADGISASRWRPLSAPGPARAPAQRAGGASDSMLRRGSVRWTNQAPSRKVEPMPQARSAAVRFRPDPRVAVTRPTAESVSGGASPGYLAQTAGAGFRPLDGRRRPAEKRQPPDSWSVVHAGRYDAVMPPPGFGWYWPAW